MTEPYPYQQPAYYPPAYEPYPPPPKSNIWRWVGGIAVALFTLGVLTALVAPHGPDSDSKATTVLEWHRTVDSTFQAISEDMGDLATASSEPISIVGMHAACARLQEDVSDLNRHMPTPKPELTTAVQGMIDQYGAAAVTCQTISFTNVSAITETTVKLSNGNAYATRALEIMQAEFGSDATLN